MRLLLLLVKFGDNAKCGMESARGLKNTPATEKYVARGVS